MNNQQLHTRFTLKRVFSKQNILLLNAIICFVYGICYCLLTVGLFPEESIKGHFYIGTIITLNVLFLIVLTLTLNTIIIIYKHIKTPRRKFIRVVYMVTLGVWIAYILCAYIYTFFLPGFFTHFHHHIRYTFRTLNLPMTSVVLAFAIGLSILFREYYRQIKMQHVLYFIIPAILQFSFKTMFPFLIFIMGWFVFGGCQLLLYFSIIDSKRYLKISNNNFVIT